MSIIDTASFYRLKTPAACRAIQVQDASAGELAAAGVVSQGGNNILFGSRGRQVVASTDWLIEDQSAGGWYSLTDAAFQLVLGGEPREALTITNLKLTATAPVHAADPVKVSAILTNTGRRPAYEIIMLATDLRSQSWTLSSQDHDLPTTLNPGDSIAVEFSYTADATDATATIIGVAVSCTSNNFRKETLTVTSPLLTVTAA